MAELTNLEAKYLLELNKVLADPNQIIDFKGGHHNPVEVKETVPKFLEEYADLWLKPSEPHMHFFVEGYRPLAWAVPLDHTDFAIKDLTSPSDIADLIVNFAKEVNVSSLLNIQQAIL